MAAAPLPAAQQVIAANDGEEVVAQDADLISIAANTPIAQFAGELAAAAQIPRNTVFLTVLSIFSGLCCRAYAVKYRYGLDTQPTSIYFCGEQPPAAAKSRILMASQKPARALVKAQKDELEKEQGRLLEKAADPESNNEKVQLRLKEVEREIAALPRFITDATPEALDAILSDSHGFCTIASAEQAAINSLLGISYSDSKKQGSSNKDVVLKGYNGEYHDSIRASRKTFSGRIAGSLCVIAQEGVINNIIEASDGSGTIERFMLWSEGHLLGQRDFINQVCQTEQSIDAYGDAVEAIYSKVSMLQDFDSLPTLSISERAWPWINELRQEFEPTLANGGENSRNLLRGVIGKIDILIMKLASVLHLSVAPNDPMIDDARVKEAMLIARAYIGHLKGLVGGTAITAMSDQEKTIINTVARYPNGRGLPQLVASLRPIKCFIVNGKTSTKFVKE
ncbi:MAG: DUF3987 domain-containing protein, partial [Enterovibrio sp.]